MVTLHKHLKLLILTRFDNQYIFARALNLPDPYVSLTLRGRRKIRKDEAAKWQELLRCKWEDLAPILRTE